MKKHDYKRWEKKIKPRKPRFIKEHYSRWKEKWKLSYDKNQYLADRNIKGDV